MSALATVSAVRSGARRPIELYRDDGPLGRALSAAGRRVRVPAILLLLAAGLPLAALLASHGDDPPRGALGLALVWAVLLGGGSGGRPHDGRFAWAVPTTLRLIEYGTLIWIAATGPDAAMPATFALLSAIAFRHYDIVYRLRHRSVPPPAWITGVGLGWEGRLLVAYALLLAGVLPAGLYVAALGLAVVSVGESAAGWARQSAGSLVDDEDDDDIS